MGSYHSPPHWDHFNLPGRLLLDLGVSAQPRVQSYELEASMCHIPISQQLPTFRNLGDAEEFPPPPAIDAWGSNTVRVLRAFVAEDLDALAAPHVVYTAPLGSFSLEAAFEQLWNGLRSKGITALLLDVCGGWHEDSLKLLLATREVPDSYDPELQQPVFYGYFIPLPGRFQPAADRTQPAVHALMCKRHRLRRLQRQRQEAQNALEQGQVEVQQQQQQQGSGVSPLCPCNHVPQQRQQQQQLRLFPVVGPLGPCSPIDPVVYPLGPCSHAQLQEQQQQQQQQQQHHQGLGLSPCPCNHAPQQQQQQQQQAHMILYPPGSSSHGNIPFIPFPPLSLSGPSEAAAAATAAAAGAVELSATQRREDDDQEEELQQACLALGQKLVEKMRSLLKDRNVKHVPEWWKNWTTYVSSTSRNRSSSTSTSKSLDYGLPALETRLSMARDLHLRQAEVPFSYVGCNYEWDEISMRLAPQELPAKFAVHECACAPEDCAKLPGRMAISKFREEGLQHKLQIFKSPSGAGWGVRALEEIPAHEYIMEYVGEYISLEEGEERELQYAEMGWHYMFDAQSRWYTQNYPSAAKVIDATHMGNATRFVNHSCNPNCDVVNVCQGEQGLSWLLLFRTSRKIEKDEELTISYMSQEGFENDGLKDILKADAEDPRLIRCACNASNCRKAVLAECIFDSPSSSTRMTPEVRKKLTSKNKRPRLEAPNEGVMEFRQNLLPRLQSTQEEQQQLARQALVLSQHLQQPMQCPPAWPTSLPVDRNRSL